MKKIILLSTVFICFLNFSYSQSGRLDASFGANGIVKTSFGANYNYGGVAKKVLIQPDGSMYVITSEGERDGVNPFSKGISAIIKKHSDGSADASYGVNGFSGFVSMSANSAAVQQDGKIVMVGSTRGYFAIARYNTDGSLDTTFSYDGIQTAGFGDYSYFSDYQYAIANSVAIDKDGKIVVVGLAAYYFDERYENNFAIARFNTDGTLDNTFSKDGKIVDLGSKANSVFIQTDGKIIVGGDGGVVRYNTDGSRDNNFIINSGGNSVVIQSDGKIVIGGYSLIRYNSDGTFDSTFSGDGVQEIGFDGVVKFVALQTDGKIVLAGFTYGITTVDSANFLTARFNTDGSPDNTFSGDGKQTLDFGEGYNIAYAIAIQSDGKIVTAGSAGKDPNIDFALVRYETNGNLDKSFDKDGKLTGRLLAANTWYSSNAVQKDGKIVAAGSTWNGSNFDFAIARYNIDGTLDNTFSGDGKQTTDFNGGDDFANLIAIQSDGKIVIGGSAIARYNTDGSLDNTFTGDGLQPNNYYIPSLAIQNDEKIVVAGGIGEGRLGLSRYNANGSLDNTFGKNGRVNYEVGDYYSNNSLAIQKDGKIVVLVTVYYQSDIGPVYRYSVIRYNTDGSLDNTFSGDGIVSNENYDDYRANGVAIQSDGTIVVVISSQSNHGVNTGADFVSYDTNGKLVKDTRNGFGISFIDFGASVAVQSDDKILVAGNLVNNFALARFNKDLSVDSSFSGDGKQITEGITGNGINSIAIANNKLYAVGSAGNLGVVARFLLKDENKAPTVTLSTPFVKYTALANIKLNAKATDTDGTITKVEFYNGTTLLHTETVIPYGYLWKNVPVGNYTLTAKAYDNSGNVTTSDAIKVTVVNENVPPLVSIVKPADNQTYGAHASVRLVAKAKDPNDTISKVEFFSNDTLIRTEYYYPYTYWWDDVQAGTYTITAVATDAKGLSSTSAPVHITVEPNEAPTVSIITPANHQTFTGPATINLEAAAKDADGTIHKVEFYNGTTLLATEKLSPYTFTWKDVPAGNYTITAKAFDNEAAPATSVINITVTSQGAIVSSRPSAKESKTGENNAISLKLYPNPAKNVLSINTTGLQQSKLSAISVISASGVVVKTMQSNASNRVVQLDVSSLTSGVYTVKIMSGDKILYKQFAKL